MYEVINHHDEKGRWDGFAALAYVRTEAAVETALRFGLDPELTDDFRKTFGAIHQEYFNIEVQRPVVDDLTNNQFGLPRQLTHEEAAAYVQAHQSVPDMLQPVPGHQS